MKPRMFQDLVMSSAVRPARGRGRALPLSLAVHGLAFAALAAVPLLKTPELVEAAPPRPADVVYVRPAVAVVTPPRVPLPSVRPPAQRVTVPVDPAPAPAAAFSTGPAFPANLSELGQGDPKIDGTPVCLHDCTPGVQPMGTAPIGTGNDGGSNVATPRRAGIDVTPPLRISGANPVYPELGKAVRAGARVVIECTIDQRGRVMNAVVTGGHPLFDAAALDAVRTWIYRPTLIDGVPVPVLMTVTVNFNLR